MSIIGSIVESVVGKLGEVLIQPLFNEASFLRGVREQVEHLKDEFETMQSFLEDADAKKLVDERVKSWIQHVRKVANEAEDAIDIFVYKIAPLRQGGFVGKLKRRALLLTKLKALHGLGKKIERINVKISEITRRRDTYGIQSITSEATQSLRRLSSPHIPEPDFVGFQEQSKSLIEHLINGEKRLCAVSLVGMAGLGKTTLAKKAYNHNAVVNYFSTHAGISVSQQYSVRELLLYIAKQYSVCSVAKLQGMHEDELISKIFKYLKNGRYLIVLDDIWERRAWDDLKGAFPDESNGSRILLTTRYRDVALYADVRSKPHELPFLTEDESWQLLRKKAFQGQEVGCTPDLESIGREIANECGGVPLAIVVMGGFLLTKRREANEWRKTLDSIHWQFGERENQVFEILSLSYSHLPFRMKPCLLYLAIFPEDYNFPASRLIRLWAAEGFLQQGGHETPEEVGEDILVELISRNLIQLAEASSNGLIQSCRIHDLLRDLCLSKAKEEAFLEVHQWSSTPSVCKGRRLALHGADASKCTCLNPSTPHLRSIFLFNENGNSSSWREMLERRQWQFLFRSFELLRVLDLEKVHVRELPCEIGKMVHLRYLRCSDTSIESLPSSMANLGNLQTLDVVRLHVNGGLHIPSAVMKMLQQLRHLQLVTYAHSIGPEDSYHKVKPHLSSNFFDIIKTSDIMTIIYVERISLGHSNQSSLVSELSLIDKSFIANSSSPMPPPLQRPLHTSCHLYLLDPLPKLPEPCDFPSKLSKLRLYRSDLKMDPLPVLEKLENLRFLVLEDLAYGGKEMACSVGGFPQLQSLHLVGLYNLEGWTVGAGSMPCLMDLLVDRCRKLKMLPKGLKYLANLKTMEIINMPPRFTDRIRSEAGEDWYKIQHIPSIKIQNIDREIGLQQGFWTSDSKLIDWQEFQSSRDDVLRNDISPDCANYAGGSESDSDTELSEGTLSCHKRRCWHRDSEFSFLVIFYYL